MTIKAILFDKDGTLFHFNETWGPWFYDVLLNYQMENMIFCGIS